MNHSPELTLCKAHIHYTVQCNAISVIQYKLKSYKLPEMGPYQHSNNSQFRLAAMHWVSSNNVKWDSFIIQSFVVKLTLNNQEKYWQITNISVCRQCDFDILKYQCWWASTYTTHGHGKQGPWVGEKWDGAAYLMWLVVYNNETLDKTSPKILQFLTHKS